MKQELMVPRENAPDEVIQSRILSDAELLQDGATIVEGKMRISDEQYDELSGNSEAGKQAGRLVLHSVLGEKTAESLEVITERAERQAGLIQDIKTVTEPYALLFNSLMPNKVNTGILSKIDKVKDMREHTTARQLEHTEARYKISGEYVAGQTVNLPKSVSMDIKNIGEWMKRKPAIELDLGFDGTNLSSINLNMNFWEHSFADMTELSPQSSGSLERFLVQTGMFTYGQKHSKIEIEMTDDVIALRTTNVTARKDPYVYTYVPDKEKLTIGVNGAGDRTVPQNISREEFVGIVGDIMGLLPVQEDS